MFHPPRPAGLPTGVTALVLGMLVVVTLLSAACSEDEGLVGTWTSEEQGETLLFRADGTATMVTSSGVMIALTWEAEGGDLTLGVRDEGTRTVDYSIVGDVLTMTVPGEEPAQYLRMQGP